MALITSRQQLITLCERAYQTWPDVRAILLFGSQAKGTAHPGSDWDIAVVVDDPAIDHVIKYKREKSPAPFDGYDNLDVLTLTPALIAQDRCAFGRITQQIDQDGQPLIGDWTMTTNDSTAPVALILPKDWRLGITTSLKHVTFAFINISQYKQGHSYDDVEADCRSFVDSSQMATEHLVKTMLKRRKVPPARTHNIERLAAQMRAHRPDDVDPCDWIALAASIESLNGDSHRDHQADYGDYRPTVEDITRSATRVSETFLLLVDEVESALHPHDVPATMGLSVKCLGDDPHQALMRTNADDVLARCHQIVKMACDVYELAETPKTFRTEPIEAVRSFFTLVRPVERIIAAQMTARLASLTSREGNDSHNSFEVDMSTTKTPSPFEI
ncbi:MAG: nucleotidyltransferase domain-containing protein [Aestuariivita sp.]|nr:nucleotidyltransferase domain-containing protein [Aestuariivita sp.]